MTLSLCCGNFTLATTVPQLVLLVWGPANCTSLLNFTYSSLFNTFGYRSLPCSISRVFFFLSSAGGEMDGWNIRLINVCICLCVRSIGI